MILGHFGQNCRIWGSFGGKIGEFGGNLGHMTLTTAFLAPRRVVSCSTWENDLGSFWGKIGRFGAVLEAQLRNLGKLGQMTLTTAFLAPRRVV